MSELYKHFSKEWGSFDYSDAMLLEMYHFETHGLPVSPNNGYHVGKRWLNVTVKMWKEDIMKGLLFPCELYEDNCLPHWWLNSVLRGLDGDVQ